MQGVGVTASTLYSLGVQAEDDLVAYLVDEYRTNAPVLRPDEKAIAHSGEEKVDVSRRFDYAVSDRSRRKRRQAQGQPAKVLSAHSLPTAGIPS